MIARIGAIAGLLVSLVLVSGIIGTFVVFPGVDMRNWLALLVGINAGFTGFSFDSLRSLNPIDISILILAAITFAGFWPALSKLRKFWNAIAIALPIAGIFLFIITGLAGRSGLMGAGITLSFLMIGIRGLRHISSLGFIAHCLLLIGDIATGVMYGTAVAAIMAAGYVLLIVWFIALSIVLFRGIPTLAFSPQERII
jgi:hypothetical protein